MVFVVVVLLQFAVLTSYCLGMGRNEEPTAVVVDAETGEPIEGAVAIAIWRKHSVTETAWFEGGKMVVVRAEEAVSDKEGKIYIDDFWDWHLFENRYPRLTIYKPGYVCWDQQVVYIAKYKSVKRNDFNKENRIVRMKKWWDDFSFIEHGGFVSSVTGGSDTLKAPKQLFRKAFDYETKYEISERTVRDNKRMEMGKRKRDKSL